MTRSEWPSFQSSLLTELVAAFRNRSKAISYHLRSFSVKSSLESGSAGNLERLNIDAHGSSSRELRLSVWADGGIWLRLCKPNSKKMGGWAFLIAFHGHMNQIPPHDMVALFEKSLNIGTSATVSSRIRSDLLRVWRTVEPCIDETQIA